PEDHSTVPCRGHELASLREILPPRPQCSPRGAPAVLPSGWRSFLSSPTDGALPATATSRLEECASVSAMRSASSAPPRPRSSQNCDATASRRRLTEACADSTNDP